MNDYIYHGTDADNNPVDLDVKLDIRLKTEQITALIKEKYSLDFDTVIERFLNSKVFENLQNPETKLWSESSAYILDEFIREMMLEDKK